MNKILAVIRREFIERVRTKAFIFGTLVVPVLGGIVMGLPALLSKQESTTRGIVVLDGTGGSLGARVDSALALERLPDSAPRYAVTVLPVTGGLEAARDSVIRLIGLREGPAGAPSGLLILSEDGVESGKVAYYGSNVSSFQAMNSLERTLGPLVRNERLERLNADSAMKAAAALRVDLQTKKVTEGKLTGESGEASFLLAYIVDMFMYISLLLYGVQIMASVIEEKSSKIIEVLVSSMRPFELLMGKVIGVGAVGLVQLGIWAGTGLYLTKVLGRGVSAAAGTDAAQAAAQTGFTMPTITSDLVVVILLFFFLGFFMYSGLYAAIGSMCNTQQEAQQAATPVTMIIVVGMITMFSTINEPSGTLARVLTFIPFFTPLVVPVRYAISPLPVSEVAMGVAVMILGTIAIVWLGARIYRVGILSYGKRPGFKELWRWVRTD